MSTSRRDFFKKFGKALGVGTAVIVAPSVFVPARAVVVSPPHGALKDHDEYATMYASACVVQPSRCHRIGQTPTVEFEQVYRRKR